MSYFSFLETSIVTDSENFPFVFFNQFYSLVLLKNILPFYFHILPQACCSFPPKAEQFIYLPDSFPIKTEQILRTVGIGHDSPKKKNQ